MRRFHADFDQRSHGHRLIGHAGDIDGFAADLAYYPDDNLIVVALSNVEAVDTSKVASRLAAVALGQPPIYLRGSMNNWGLDHEFKRTGPTTYSVDVKLPKGSLSFKIGSEDWDAVNLGAEAGGEAYELGGRKLLGTDGQKISVDVPQSGTFNFSLDLKDPNAPNLIVTLSGDQN